MGARSRVDAPGGGPRAAHWTGRDGSGDARLGGPDGRWGGAASTMPRVRPAPSPWIGELRGHELEDVGRLVDRLLHGVRPAVPCVSLDSEPRGRLRRVGPLHFGDELARVQ